MVTQSEERAAGLRHAPRLADFDAVVAMHERTPLSPGADERLVRHLRALLTAAARAGA